jgi:hypothetical protein
MQCFFPKSLGGESISLYQISTANTVPYSLWVFDINRSAGQEKLENLNLGLKRSLEILVELVAKSVEAHY